MWQCNIYRPGLSATKATSTVSSRSTRTVSRQSDGAPSPSSRTCAGFHGYRSVGAAARTYRWRPAFHRAGYERPGDLHDAVPFHRRARIFLELLAVAHAAPVLPLVELSHRIDRSGRHHVADSSEHPWVAIP